MKTPDNAPDIKVGHKTPDEIKKGLERCNRAPGYKDCKNCPYFEILACTSELRFDTLALIQQLQAENAEQAERIKQLEAERDAAVADITRMVQEPYDPCYCDYCKLTEEECAKSNCRGRNAFVWRGLQKEETP